MYKLKRVFRVFEKVNRGDKLDLNFSQNGTQF